MIDRIVFCKYCFIDLEVNVVWVGVIVVFFIFFVFKFILNLKEYILFNNLIFVKFFCF